MTGPIPLQVGFEFRLPLFLDWLSPQGWRARFAIYPIDGGRRGRLYKNKLGLNWNTVQISLSQSITIAPTARQYAMHVNGKK